MIRIVVSPDPIDIGGELARIGRAGAGALSSFTGLVRDDGGVTELFLEHYPSVTEQALEAIARESADRWSLLAATIVHRVGPMVPGEAIVLVVSAAAHRQAAIEATAFMIDQLKTGAPFWKRERRGDDRRWVEARDADAAAAARWMADGG